jgi:hypothetical protein
MHRSIIRPQMFRNVFALVMLACSASCMEGADEPSGQEVSELNLGTSSYDSSTSCIAGGVSMHCCPNGAVMIGANVGSNVFKCGTLAGIGGQRFLDLGTARNGMHACPSGAVMVGLHAANNWLACQFPPTAPVIEFTDSSTKDSFPMHICPVGSAMGGINVGANQFTCDF